MCQNFHMPANIRDCVPGVAGAKLTGKINVDLLLFFLNCLRAVLAVAEAINYPCEFFLQTQAVSGEQGCGMSSPCHPKCLEGIACQD